MTYEQWYQTVYVDYPRPAGKEDESMLILEDWKTDIKVRDAQEAALRQQLREAQERIARSLSILLQADHE